MKQGDLVLVSFPFTDLSGSKIRPALVLMNTALNVTLAFVSTQLHCQEPTDILLSPNSQNGLKKPSLVRLSKLATIGSVSIEPLRGTIYQRVATDSPEFEAVTSIMTASGVFADMVSIGS